MKDVDDIYESLKDYCLTKKLNVLIVQCRHEN